MVDKIVLGGRGGRNEMRAKMKEKLPFFIIKKKIIIPSVKKYIKKRKKIHSRYNLFIF